MKKKIFIWVLLSLLGIVILGLILLPGMVKRYAINNSKELVGRQIELDKLKLNYFTGLIKITDFKMFEANEKDVFVSFDTLIVNLELFQFFIDEFVMESFYLKGLETNVIQYDSTFNLDDLIAFHKSDDDTIFSDTIQEEPFHFQLSNIEIVEAEFQFDDRNISKLTHLNDISFFIPFIGWNQEEKSNAGLRFAFKDEGYFESSIDVDPIEGDFEAEINIHHLFLNAFEEYATNYININGIDGFLNSQINITGNIKEVEKLLISGNAEVRDFIIEDQKNKEVLGVNKLDCVIKEVDIDNMSFIVDSLILTEPYAYFELDSASNNFKEIFSNSNNIADSNKTQNAEYDTIKAKRSDSLFYAVNFLQIHKGEVDYTDNLTGEPFNYHLSEIIMNSDSIKSTSDWIELYAQMILNDRGSLKAEVGLNPSNPLDIYLEYVITDFQLGDLNIYSRHYMGFPIVYGDLYYKSETHIRDGQLKSENKLIIEHIELGEKSGGLYSLPLKFAFFILKDKDGIINLEIPVRGDLNDPKVNVGKIIWSTFKNLIVKVAAAPFTFLAGLISVDPKDIEEIEFAYNDTTLSDKRIRQLDLLLELEQKKDGLDIELVYFNDIEKEKSQIAISEIANEFNSKTNKNYQSNQKEFAEFVYSKIDNDSIAIEEACISRFDPMWLDSLIQLYSITRMVSIERYLKNANDSTQIHTSLSSPDAPKNLGSLPIFEVKYSMKNDGPDGE